MAVNSITFGGVNSADFGIYIGGEGTFDAPQRVVETVQIPGRNGALTIDMVYYENIEVEYSAFNYESTLATFRQQLAGFRSAIGSKIGYQRLSDTFHPDEYRLAVYHDDFEIKPINYNTASKFSIVFDCKPQRFLTSGEATTTLTADGSITNPTLFASRPLITVTGNGTLTVNGTAIIISGTSNTVIDCDAMEIYDGSDNKSGDVSMSPNEFPTLSPGANAIEMTSGITKVEIVPRWWRL